VPVTWANSLILLTGVAFNATLFFRLYRQVNSVKFSSLMRGDAKSRFLGWFFWTSCAALAFIPANMTLLMLGVRAGIFKDFHVVAIALSFVIFVETYFLWRYPEIIREEKAPALQHDDASEWISRLNEIMITRKPYKNVDLTVSELAEMLGTKPHFLSRIINEVHQKNFRDFVNTYRIEEFIALAGSKEFKHYTFLALAQEVGFNSKSTFNLAFKKLTNQSPREYFKRPLETAEDPTPTS